jgi:hypothetical protein
MKKINFIMIISFVIFMSVASIAQSQETASSTPPFTKLLGQTLAGIQANHSPESVMSGVNGLKRISAAFPDEWLADYYIAFFDLKSSFVAAPEQKTALIAEAKKEIDILKEKSNALPSEVYTLEGYYYYALIAQNPQQNGAVYYKDVFASYQRAIGIDPSNPRPALMLIIFKSNMAKFMNQEDANICTDLIKVQKLFDEFKPKEALAPSWGAGELQNMQIKYCSASKE